MSRIHQYGSLNDSTVVCSDKLQVKISRYFCLFQVVRIAHYNLIYVIYISYILHNIITCIVIKCYKVSKISPHKFLK